MRPRRLLFVAFALLPALVVALAGGSTLSPTRIWERVWVLDSGAKTLVCVGLPHGKRLVVLTLEGAPEFLLHSPDGSRLIVLDRGPGEDAGERGYKAKGKSVATIVDPVSRAIVARVELGSGVDPHSYYFSPDGRRLTLLCPGYEHKKEAKALARELVNIDLVTGIETGRVTLEHGTVPIDTDGQTLTLMQGLPRGSAPPFGQGRLWIVDLTGPAVVGAVATGGWARVDTDGSYVNLLHTGRPHKNPRYNRNGTLLVYSVARRALETTLDVGRNPRALYRDDIGAQVFILSDAPAGSEDETADRLHVVRGSKLAATLEVAANPRLVERKGETVFVVGEAAVNLIDPVSLQVMATIPLRSDEGALVDDDDVPTELELTPDGKRAFILYGLHNRVAVLDLATNVAVGSTKTGQGDNKKLLAGLNLAIIAADLLGFPGWATAPSQATLWTIGYPPSPKVTPKMLVVRPDGRYGYAINSQTRDVTVIASANAGVLETIDSGGHELRFLPDGDVLAVLSASAIHLIDTATNRKIDELFVSKLRAFETTPDGAYVVALGKSIPLCLDGTTGKVLTRLTDFVNPVALAFENAAVHNSAGGSLFIPEVQQPEARQPRR